MIQFSKSACAYFQCVTPTSNGAGGTRGTGGWEPEGLGERGTRGQGIWGTEELGNDWGGPGDDRGTRG